MGNVLVASARYKANGGGFIFTFWKVQPWASLPGRAVLVQDPSLRGVPRVGSGWPIKARPGSASGGAGPKPGSFRETRPHTPSPCRLHLNLRAVLSLSLSVKNAVGVRVRFTVLL